MLTLSENRRALLIIIIIIIIMMFGIVFLCVFVVVGAQEEEGGVPRIYYDWSNRYPGIPVAHDNDPRRWKSAQPFVFKLKSPTHYLMMFYDHRNEKIEFSVNPADNNDPALTVGDIEALLDPELIRKVRRKIVELRLTSHLRSPDEPQTEKKLYPLPDKYRLDDVCLVEKYKNVCVNATGENKVRVWEAPLGKSGIIRLPSGRRRSRLKLIAMYDPNVGQTLFNTFPGRFTLTEWKAMTSNESIAEILDFYETIE